MLNNIMKMMNNNLQNSISKIMDDINKSGMSPEQYAINLLNNQKGKISLEKMEEFKNFAKQLGATDEQINMLLNNFEKK